MNSISDINQLCESVEALSTTTTTTPAPAGRGRGGARGRGRGAGRGRGIGRGAGRGPPGDGDKITLLTKLGTGAIDGRLITAMLGMSELDLSIQIFLQNSIKSALENKKYRERSRAMPETEEAEEE